METRLAVKWSKERTTNIMKNLLTNQFYFIHKLDVYYKKTINATYDEVIEMWEKVAESASPGYTCCTSRKTERKKRSNLYQMLKKAEDPIPKRHTSFSVFQEMISSSASVEDYNFDLDQKGLRQATFVGKSAKLVKKLKCKSSRDENFEKRKASKLESA